MMFINPSQKGKIIMGIKISVNHQAIADALIKSGDLDRNDCACGLEYKHDRESELLGLINLALNTIAIFGAAGLRDLAIHANELADEEEFRAAYEVAEKERRAAELDLKVRADAQAKAEAEKALGEAQLSEYDQLALMGAVGSIGGDMDAYDLAKTLVRRKVYSVAEIMRLSSVQLRHLLS